MTTPVVDLHIHVAARDRPDCLVSKKTLWSPAFLYMVLGNQIDLLQLADDFDGTIRKNIIDPLNASESVDKGVLLALDGVYRNGKLQRDRSNLVVSNDYVRELARQNPKVLFGASVNPTRADAKEELERCLTGDPPAALVKWLPNSQEFHPKKDVPDWFYDRLKQENVPLLCHTGPEYAVPVNKPKYQGLGDPRLLKRALDRGVTVIAAHCATRFFPLERQDYLPELRDMMRMADKKKWKLYADVSAMCTLSRIGTVDNVLESLPKDRLVLGSDFPIPVETMPWLLVRDLDRDEASRLINMKNPIEKNYQQLLAMGFPETIGTTAAELLNPKALT